MLLVADLGGTNARFAIYDPESLALIKQVKLPAAAFDTVELATQSALKELQSPGVSAVCFGVAGPVENGVCKLTNLKWTVNVQSLANLLSIDKGRVSLANDFVALATGASFAPTSGMKEVIRQFIDTDLSQEKRLVVGPGTGLGQAFIRADGGIEASEAGHMLWAPLGDRERAVQAKLIESLGREYIRVEDVCSGPGLARLCSALHASSLRNDTPISFQPGEDRAAKIAQLAGEGNQLCREAITMCFNILGTHCRNLALIGLAKGGVLIAGGVAQKNADLLVASEFNRRFLHGYPPEMDKIVNRIPAYLITDPDIALLGAAKIAQRSLELARGVLVPGQHVEPPIADGRHESRSPGGRTGGNLQIQA